MAARITGPRELRAQLLKFRVMQTNAQRGFLYEFGPVLPEGYRALAQ